jgi:hypothetical protein
MIAPTGPLEEVSVSSGWAQELLNMAMRFDAAWELDEVTAL